jgi:hypothetical protein
LEIDFSMISVVKHDYEIKDQIGSGAIEAQRSAIDRDLAPVRRDG